MEPNTQENLYRIGTVSSLTGISIERLRAWERRYDLSPAHKSGKTRYYSRAQLERLRLIKHLIDLGQPISSLAPLTTEQLKARIEDQAPDIGRLEVVHKPTVGIAGANLLMLENQMADQNARLEVVQRWANIDTLFAEGVFGTPPQIMVLQLPVLSRQPIDFIKETYPDTKIVTVYQFATEHLISDLAKEGLQTLRWPITWSELEHIAISELGLSSRAQSTLPRRYSDDELIALAAIVDDGTNCPQYLIEAINQLNAFTLFAGDTAQAADRPMIYERLQNDASQARAQLEQALEDLVSQLPHR